MKIGDLVRCKNSKMSWKGVGVVLRTPKLKVINKHEWFYKIYWPRVGMVYERSKNLEIINKSKN